MSDYLSSFRLEETVYYLNARGRKEVGSSVARRRTIHVPHTLMRNEVFIRYRPDYWRPEFPIKWADKCVIPDAVFRMNGNYVFLECDHTQSMAQNERKIASYRELRDTGIFQRKYGAFPLIMYVTVSEYRLKLLRALLDGLHAEVLRINDLR
ncbi:hypothetical protein J31TS4_40500 [Paenibacillus sp. J31TS4]|nr:hypothetical protein J31TS4_40500 [Paenibacillus sp. J31TS4]